MAEQLPIDAGAAATAGGWTDPGFTRVAGWLHAEAGLVFPATRRSAVESSLRRVMAAARLPTPDALHAALQRGGPIVDAVIGELTIGETYFFRDPRQLAAVRELAFPDPGDQSRPFRVWSAGCASGEEPYTLAIMLRESRPGHPVRILGTDLASTRLASARRGRYTRWSFRGLAPEVIARYFAAERQHFVLDPAVRAAVEFRVLNLAEDAYPSPATGIGAMDVILCRNVLIYFDAETVRKVAERLIDSLSDDGWLFLGASDPMIGNLVACETVITDAGLAYRRPRAGAATFVPSDLAVDRRSAVPAVPAAPLMPPFAPWIAPPSDDPVPPVGTVDRNVWMGGVPVAAPDLSAPSAAASPAAAPDAASDAAAALAAYASGDYDRSAELAARVLLRGPDEALAIVHVRSLANRGRLAEAGVASAAALERHAASAELEYLHALVLDAGGHHAAAITAVRRALYLNRQLAVAHLLLGELLARAGDRAGAVRSFRNAEALLAPLPAEASVPGADGAPAARLLHIARARADSLTGTGR